MKKIFTLAAIVATTLSFAQVNPQEGVQTDSGNDEKNRVISANFTFSDPSQAGLYFETPGFSKNRDNVSAIVHLSYGMMDLDVPVIDDITGSGFVIEIGSRQYYSKSKRYEGFYTGNYLSYGNISFDEDTDFGNFDGKYSYFSFFSPELGYKMKFGSFVIDPFLGIMWKIEVKGKGDVDNNYVDEWAPRAGLKIGFSF